MKYVHAAVALNPAAGIVQQMNYEAEAASRLGIDWTVWMCQGSELGPALQRWPRFLRAALLRLRFFVGLVRRSRAGYRIVLRHSHGDPIQYGASFLLGSYYTVHHTFEEAELSISEHRVARLLFHLERAIGRRTVARARGIVCATPEIAQHELGRVPPGREKSVFIYPNGVLYPAVAEVPPDERGSRPEILFLASQFLPWHGLEEVLESMSRSTDALLLHIVGELPCRLRGATGLDRRILVHGTLDARAIGQLMKRAWVGLSSFSLAQKNMTEACTLKVREYLRSGVPVYAGHRDSALPPDFEFFRRGPADIADIAGYAREMRNVSRQAVSTAARPFIDKQALLNQLHGALQRDANAAEAKRARLSDGNPLGR